MYRCALNIEIFQDRDVTLADAEMHSSDPGGGWRIASLGQASGSAKRCRGDRFDSGIGVGLAVERALTKLGVLSSADTEPEVPRLAPKPEIPWWFNAKVGNRKARNILNELIANGSVVVAEPPF